MKKILLSKDIGEIPYSRCVMLAPEKGCVRQSSESTRTHRSGLCSDWLWRHSVTHMMSPVQNRENNAAPIML